ncbi:hypothetical protein EV663_1232 [Rhodovulum bhavnagarense]|uniref:Uncharacterized protein n=1 Tax=Rhodovulum bhavnagarense TaxID=992286 RepID=A0A4R2R7C3_9RHOB|nr:hypothetical protein [Rhodovulum bhavnagarense]TCP58503.1 hypothetical protein EV663_1232 [Rhodovulum bhavnagarense]
MEEQLIGIGRPVRGRDREGYDLFELPFGRTQVSVAGYHEAPLCDLFFQRQDLYPAMFELNLIGMSICYAPIIAWTGSCNGLNADAGPVWPAHGPGMAIARFWAGVQDVHGGDYYLGTTEFPDDRAAGLGAVGIADRLLRQAARRSMGPDGPGPAGAGMRQAPDAMAPNTPLDPVQGFAWPEPDRQLAS